MVPVLIKQENWGIIIDNPSIFTIRINVINLVIPDTELESIARIYLRVHTN